MRWLELAREVRWAFSTDTCRVAKVPLELTSGYMHSFETLVNIAGAGCASADPWWGGLRFDPVWIKF